ALYHPRHDRHSIDRLELAAQLRNALHHRQLIVHYQPKIPTGPDAPPAVEALVRWHHPQHGTLTPNRFIPVAEQTGLITPITHYVLQTAICQCQAWRQAGLEISVSVNISTRTLLDHSLPATIQALLAEHQLPPGALQLEITETRLVTDLRSTRAMLERLRQTGVTIAIDDFGTGYSSLKQLQQLPINEIKIDRTFTAHIQTNPDDVTLLRTIIDLAHNLGLQVTAKGVETSTTHQALAQLGCDYTQGHHHSPPLPPHRCRQLLLRHQAQQLAA
ncbi:MAG: EAL domain-containing protein, partial [Solirubrobacteraceae bacterium]